MDLTIFKANVPITISGELDKELSKDDPQLLGAVDNKGTSKEYYLAGLDVGLLKDAGITDVSQLSQLHSMSNAGTLQVIRFESQSDVIGVFLSDALIKTLENNPELERLAQNNWRLYRLEEPTSDSPKVGRFVETGRIIRFPEIRKEFANIIKNGYQTDSERSVNNVKVAKNISKEDTLRALGGGGGSLDLKIEKEETERDIANRYADQYEQESISQNNETQPSEGAVENEVEPSTEPNEIVTAVEEVEEGHVPSVESSKTENEAYLSDLFGEEFEEELENVSSYQATASQTNEAVNLQDTPIRSSVLNELGDWVEPSEEILKEAFSQVSKFDNLSILYFEAYEPFIQLLDQFGLDLDTFYALDEEGQRAIGEWLNKARKRLAQTLIRSLEQAQRETRALSDLSENNPRQSNLVKEQYQTLYLDPVEVLRDEMTQNSTNEMIEIDKAIDSEFEEWYERVQADPRGVYNEMFKEANDQRKNDVILSYRQESDAEEAEILKKFTNWLEETFYKERYETDIEDAKDDLSNHLNVLQSALDTQLETERLQSELREARRKEEALKRPMYRTRGGLLG